MAERPILFSAPMVRAILAGTKTQTRRIVKPWGPRLHHEAIPADVAYLPDFTCYRATCPYGQPGDRLWVRESHWWFKDEPDHSCGYYPPRLTAEDVVYRADGDDGRKVWRPSIHMPRWASRITLEITGVRVERLQDISIEDAKAEGAWGPDDSIVVRVANHFGIDLFAANPRLAFRMLWESINGPGSWDANPWTWVIEFKRLREAAGGGEG